MLHDPVLITPNADFWPLAARAILAHPALASVPGHDRDWSSLTIVVPTMTHAQLLKAAFGLQMTGSVILPRIVTLSGWLAEQPPKAGDAAPASASERLMSLYAELRQHAWLKKLFSARRNTDLLPLAKTLLCLSDELTQSLLPQLQLAPDSVLARWQQALEQLSTDAQQSLSDEAQLVWSIWQSQLERNDACAVRYARMMELAGNASMPLVWIAPAEMDAFDQSFLAAYSQRQAVLPIQLDWRAAAVHPAYALAWQELTEPVNDTFAPSLGGHESDISIRLCKASGLESEAQQGAQTVIDWIAAGKTSIAIVAQDRVVARRIRALLERAQIRVADETGWKLSTTRAAAAMAAWLEVVASRAETVAMLDLLKSPYVFADIPDKADCVMRIEAALRRANVLGGWKAIGKALEDMPQELDLIARIAEQARQFTKRKTVPEWIAATLDMLHALEMEEPLAADPAGVQLRAVLDALQLECGLLEQPFSFAEWRALVSLHLESTDFTVPEFDRRVVMLPLNGARLRAFDAVLLVGADAEHLPSQPNETLFFANAVRRELGLATRESLQRQQLRDFTELLSANSEVVLSWQESRDGEPNPVSPWIERLELTLARHGMPTLPIHGVEISHRELMPIPPVKPMPSAPQLLPKKLSASAYNSLAACPYQFFAQRMLGLSALEELSDLPQKRDYGDWLHQILKKYHDAISERKVSYSDRTALLHEISDQIFQPILEQSPAALGYYVRWQKVIPAYLDWANERESLGWRFAIGEKWFEKKLPLPHGEMVLHGRIDRIDENEAGEWAVLDYKTASHTTLKGRLGKCEDHQLAFYGLIAEKPVAAGHYVALELTKDKTGDVAAPNYDQWQHQLSAQIVANLRAISMGATLPAAGVEAICQYCDVRGLCRKGAW